MGLIGVASGTDNGIRVQCGLVSNNNLCIGNSAGNLLQIRNLNVESAAIVSSSRNSVLIIGQLNTTNSDIDRSGVKGQAVRLFIMENKLIGGVISKVACDVSSQLERNFVANVVVGI